MISVGGNIAPPQQKKLEPQPQNPVPTPKSKSHKKTVEKLKKRGTKVAVVPKEQKLSKTMELSTLPLLGDLIFPISLTLGNVARAARGKPRIDKLVFEGKDKEYKSYGQEAIENLKEQIKEGQDIGTLDKLQAAALPTFFGVTDLTIAGQIRKGAVKGVKEIINKINPVDKAAITKAVGKEGEKEIKQRLTANKLAVPASVITKLAATDDAKTIQNILTKVERGEYKQTTKTAIEETGEKAGTALRQQFIDDIAPLAKFFQNKDTILGLTNPIAKYRLTHAKYQRRLNNLHDDFLFGRKNIGGKRFLSYSGALAKSKLNNNNIKDYLQGTYTLIAGEGIKLRQLNRLVAKGDVKGVDNYLKHITNPTGMSVKEAKAAIARVFEIMAAGTGQSAKIVKAVYEGKQKAPTKEIKERVAAFKEIEAKVDRSRKLLQALVRESSSATDEVKALTKDPIFGTHYIPLLRQGAGSVLKTGKPKEGFKGKRTGSERAILDPIQSMFKLSQQIATENASNEIYQEIADAMIKIAASKHHKGVSLPIKVLKTNELLKTQKLDKGNLIEFYVGGKQMGLQVNNEQMWKAFQAYEKRYDKLQAANMAQKMFDHTITLTNKVFKGTITDYNPL